jgi:hypothetical protein
MKQKIIEAKIKNVHWITDRRGFIQPIFKMTKKLPDGFDSLAIPLSEVRKMGVGVGSVFKLALDAGSTYNIISAIKLKELAIPDNCPACDSELVIDLCSNEFCLAHGRTPVRKLFMQFTDALTVADVYLDKFPRSFEATINIGDFSDFIHYLKTSGGIGTTARHSIIEKHLGASLVGYGITAQQLATWESSILEMLTVRKDGELSLSPEAFWDLFYIPKLNTADREVLKLTNPLSLDFRNLPLSKDGNKLLIENASALFRFLDLIRK